MSIEDRIVELETRMAFQEDQLDQLNQALSTQQLELTESKKLVKLLFERLSDLSVGMEEGAQKGVQERPPHY